MSRKFSVVTTFNQSGYDKYASRMIDTFLQNWPSCVDLYVYAENCSVSQSADNLKVYSVETQLPDLVNFKLKWQNDPKAVGKQQLNGNDRRGKPLGIGFKWDAVRFSHKVYAVCDAARHLNSDVMFWMDADTVCHSPIDIKFIEMQMPEPVEIAYFGRSRKYTECGFYGLNLRSQITQYFVELFQWQYDNAEQGIFSMKEWHDSWVFDRVREQIKSRFPDWHQYDWSNGIVQGEGHPLINSSWGAYLDHLKGDSRKKNGKSSSLDLRIARNETYWTNT